MTGASELAAARAAALRAGKWLRETCAQPQQVMDATGRDLKLRADRDAEALILEVLCQTGHPVLAEETGEHGSLDAGPAWIVDPLDGTINFSRGIPLSCVSIALWAGVEPLLGVIYDFFRDQLYTGEVSAGAWCGDRRLAVSDVTEPRRAVLATGFPAGRDFDDEPLRRFIRRVQRFKKVRLFGSAALSLAYLASGRIDAYAEEDIMLWDVAAGIALVKAAGGSVRVEPSARGKWARSVRCASSESIWSETGGEAQR